MNDKISSSQNVFTKKPISDAQWPETRRSSLHFRINSYCTFADYLWRRHLCLISIISPNIQSMDKQQSLLGELAPTLVKKIIYVK